MAVSWRGLTFTPGRITQVSAIVVLLLLGAVLPYLTMLYINYASELEQSTERLFGAADLVARLDPTYLPVPDTTERGGLTLALNVFGAGPALQQVATVVAVATCWGLFYNEINKFWWWPLHLSSYLLMLVPLPLFVGLRMLRSLGVTVSVGPGWLPAVLAGILVFVLTLRVRDRVDTYSGI